jgi:hypothetical protein
VVKESKFQNLLPKMKITKMLKTKSKVVMTRVFGEEPLFPSQHMHHEAQRIYTLIYIYNSRAIKDRIIKEGSARFIIIMHLK